MRTLLVLSLVVLSKLCTVSATAVHVPQDARGKQQVAVRNRRSNMIRPQFLPRGGSESTPAKVLKKFASDARMPSLFSPEDIAFDRYSACLAATEGLRRIRDRDMIDEVKSADSLLGGSELSEREQSINKEYIKNSAKVLQAMGLSVKQFNELGQQISRDDRLRERVMEQAYLYRMAATIQMDKFPLIEDESRGEAQDFQRDKVQLFCESMSEIEHLREDQIDRLKRALQVDTFPSTLSISDPSLLPFLSPKVRAVVEAFPYQAEEIIKKHGLGSEEFNQMLAETRSNPMFRWKVQKHIRNVGQKLPQQ